MKLIIVNRIYLIGGKWFRYHRMIGVGMKNLGFKIGIGKYEFRFYKNKTK